MTTVVSGEQRSNSLTFRVFVSSTFEDMVEERNALQVLVYPRLRVWCESRGAKFVAIDLRWGVAEGEAYDHKTMNICLEEIERCQSVTAKPNFIFFLGQRYGWRPLPERLLASELTLLRSVASPDERALLDGGWWERDDNSVH